MILAQHEPSGLTGRISLPFFIGFGSGHAPWGSAGT